MLKRLLPAIVLILVMLGAAGKSTWQMLHAKNPDPNHTHADFAVWINGTKLDFSSDKYMTTEKEEDEPNLNPLRKYLHMHDNVGWVIHRHKPGLTIGDFFRSLGTNDKVEHTAEGVNLCIQFPQLSEPACADEAGHRTWVMKINDGDIQSLDFNYIFNDGDKILIALPIHEVEVEQDAEVATYWSHMTNDACLYSLTCPWRPKPAKKESCIADPEVPCTQ